MTQIVIGRAGPSHTSRCLPLLGHDAGGGGVVSSANRGPKGGGGLPAPLSQWGMVPPLPHPAEDGACLGPWLPQTLPQWRVGPCPDLPGRTPPFSSAALRKCRWLPKHVQRGVQRGVQRAAAWRRPENCVPVQPAAVQQRTHVTGQQRIAIIRGMRMRLTST